MTGFLASVMNVAEARIALTHGADIIDLKNPLAGALGALPLETVREIVRAVDGEKPVSATIGDLPLTPHSVLPAVQVMAATGVDMVKIGLFEQGQTEACLQQLGGMAKQTRLVLVMFADVACDWSLMPMLAQAGFYGAMLDTAHKNGRRLVDSVDKKRLAEFVAQAKSLGLKTGLAGSLTTGDAQWLKNLGADYLGFRGALCNKSNRANGLESSRVGRAARLLHASNTSRPARRQMALGAA